jgi:hypothetical protein
MATVAPTVAGVVQVVEHGDQKTCVAAAALVGGTLVREDTAGNWVQALGTTLANADGAFLLLRTLADGEPGTGMRTGLVGGFTISQAFNATLFISDTGTVADAAGTASMVIGSVSAGRSNLAGVAADKLIRLDIPVGNA